MFSGGGAFSNVYRRLAKSALTALALIAATFTANAAEVISINFARYAAEDWNSGHPNEIGDIKGDGVYPGIIEDQITADAWNNILRDQDGGANSSKFLTTYWNGSAAATLPDNTVKVAWKANAIWSNDVNANDVVKAYLDDNGQDPTATVTGIPYDTYDVIIYCHGENPRNKFHPYIVNGWSYTYADGATVFNGTADWGNRQQQPEEGKNALRINGLSGDLTIKGQRRTNDANGTISSIQIIKNTGTATKPNATDYSFGPNPATATGWFTAWNGLGSHRMVGPEGVDVFLADGGPWAKFDCAADAVTIAVIINADNVALSGNEAALLTYGRTEGTSRGLLLTKAAGQDGYTLKLYHSGATANPVSVSGVGEGFHLVVITFANGENDSTISLKVDNGAPVTETLNGRFLFDASDEGMQIADSYGGAAPAGMALDNGYGVAFDRILGWNGALNAEQQAALYGGYSSLLTDPMALTYTSDYSNGADGKIYMPSMKGDYSLRGSRGTVEIPATSKIEVPSICFGNGGQPTYTLTVNIAGDILVTSDSGTQYHVWNDKDNKKGVLLGHWTTGQTTINLTGTLAATNAFTQVEQQAPTQLNIYGGTLTTRGLFARVGADRGATISLTNGGTLEFARFVGPADTNLGDHIPLTAGKGTIRAIKSGDYTTGWTYPSAVSFTDATDGTTLDPNGLTVSFTGASSGAGKIIVNDTSASHNGIVTIANAANITGTFSVVNGALYLPDTYTPVLDANTKEDTTGALTGYRKYVNSSYVAQYVATAQIDGGTVESFYTIERAIQHLNGNAGTITLLADVIGETATLAEGQRLDLNGHTIGTVSAASGVVLGLLNGVYTAYSDVTTEPETWTGLGGDISWKNAANWSLGFVPLKTTPVMIPSEGATISIAAHDETETCASMVLDGDLTLTYASPTADGGWPVLYFYDGGVSGSGTLTLERACLRNLTQTEQTIEVPLVVAADSRGDSSLLGSPSSASGWQVSGNFTVNDGAYLVVRDGPLTVTGTASIGNNATLGPVKAMTFNGATTLNGNFTRDDGYANVTFNGAVTVAETTAIPDSNDMHAVFNGAVTVAAGKTLTMPAGRVTFGANAVVELALGATLVDGSGTLDAITASQGYVAKEITTGVWRGVEVATWTDAVENDSNWTTAGNWSTEQVPTETTFVTIPEGALIYISHTGGEEKCAGIELEGDATIRYDGNNWAQIYMYGGIVGDHTLTLHHACLCNMFNVGLEIASGLVVDTVLAGEGDGDCAMLGANGWTISGDLEVKGFLKVQNHALNVTGDATIEDGAKFAPWGQTITFGGTTTLNGSFTLPANDGLVFGDITVAGTTTMPNDAKVTFNGTVTITAKQPLTIPASATIDDGAMFVLAGFGAKLVDNGGLVAEDKVTTPIEKGAKIVITSDGDKNTYRLIPVGFTIRLR